MTMTVTLVLLGGAVAVAVLANILARRPTEFGKVRLFPYLGVQFIALALAIFLAAHVLTLWSGK
jgi:uncharacterized membrane protein